MNKIFKSILIASLLMGLAIQSQAIVITYSDNPAIAGTNAIITGPAHLNSIQILQANGVGNFFYTFLDAPTVLVTNISLTYSNNAYTNISFSITTNTVFLETNIFGSITTNIYSVIGRTTNSYAAKTNAYAAAFAMQGTSNVVTSLSFGTSQVLVQGLGFTNGAGTNVTIIVDYSPLR